MAKRSRLKPRSVLLGPDEVTRDLADLPSAAAVLPQLLRLLGDDSANVENIVQLLKMDQGVSARVMKIGNSAYYSQGYRCQSVEEALARVGMLKTYEVVAQAAAADLLMRRLRTYGIEPEEFWKQSVTCAMAAALLGRYVDIDEHFAYTIGLLHGAGIVAVDYWATSTHEDGISFQWKGFPLDATEDEREILGFTSASAAGSLLKSWGFQPGITEPIRWQFTPDAAGGYRKMASVLHVAKWIRDSAHITERTERPALPDPKILAVVGVSNDDLDTLCTTVAEEFERAGKLLAVPRKDDAAPPDGPPAAS
jgi:HD-like signal output (HDOD) protein